jgi:hypothetical protein
LSKNRPKVKQCKRCFAKYQVSPSGDIGAFSGMVQSPECPHRWEFPKGK